MSSFNEGKYTFVLGLMYNHYLLNSFRDGENYNLNFFIEMAEMASQALANKRQIWAWEIDKFSQ